MLQGSASTSGTSCPSGASGPSGSAGTPNALRFLGSTHASHAFASRASTSHASGASASGASTSHASGASASGASASSASGLSVSVGAAGSSDPPGSLMPVGVGAVVVTGIANVPNPPAPVLPSDDTDLYFTPGTNRLTLSNQKLLIRIVVQDGIENLWASLLFDNAFPNAADAVRVVRRSLLDAADNYRPVSAAIYQRLNTDHQYMSTMARLVNEVYIFMFLV